MSQRKTITALSTEVPGSTILNCRTGTSGRKSGVSLKRAGWLIAVCYSDLGDLSIAVKLQLLRLKSRSRKQSSGAVCKSRWTSWAPVPNKPTVSVDVKQHSAI